MTKEIVSRQEVESLVDTFYGKVRKDPLLGPIFEERIGKTWDTHLDKMYRFWETVLLGERTYQGSPFPPHATMPIGKEHFHQWLTLFTDTVEEQFEGEKAKEALWRAGQMAKMFEYKIAYMREHNTTPLH